MMFSVKGEALTGDHLVKPFVEFVMSKNVSKRVLNNVTLSLEFTDRVHRNKVIPIYGEMCVVDHAKPKPRNFEVRVSRTVFGFHRKLLILAHELHHVCQVVNGNLYFYEDTSKVRWMGEEVTVHQDCRLDYWSRPWECEARGQEMLLVEHFVILHGLEGADWIDPSLAC